jgi:hypothetical protein
MAARISAVLPFFHRQEVGMEWVGGGELQRRLVTQHELRVVKNEK